MAKLAFLGLGVMGYPMAGHLQAAGHEVTVYNRTAAKAEAWVEQHGGARAATPRAARSRARARPMRKGPPLSRRAFPVTCAVDQSRLSGVSTRLSASVASS